MGYTRISDQLQQGEKKELGEILIEETASALSPASSGGLRDTYAAQV